MRGLAVLFFLFACSSKSSSKEQPGAASGSAPGPGTPSVTADAGSAAPSPANEATSKRIKRTGAGTPDATGWYEAHSEDGKFTVHLPAAFNEMDIDGKNASGGKSTTYSLGTQTPDGIRFSAACTHGGDGDPAQLVAALPAKMSAKAHREITVAGQKAVELTVETGMGNAMMQAVAFPDHVCLLIVDTQNAKLPAPEKDARRFFESFKVDAT